jgi:hypothetical protein
LAWESASVQGGGKTTGESTMNVGSGAPQPYQYGQMDLSWLRPIQQKDRLTLQFADSPFGFGGPFAAPEPWVRIVEPAQEGGQAEADEKEADSAKATTGEAKPAAEKSRLDEFNALKFDELSKLKAKLPQPRMLGGGQQMGPRPPMVLAAEPGRIFVGSVQHRDNRTGQPINLTFKVLVEELSIDDEGE